MRVTSETKTATRRRILEVAKKLFRERGYENTTTRDIAGAAEIAVGTLFNYFPTKEAIVACFVREAYDGACAPDTSAVEPSAAADTASPDQPAAALEEALFAQVAAELRALKPYRKYLSPALETALSANAANATEDLRQAHLETFGRITSRHGYHAALSPVAQQLYWTLYTGVLTFWSQDSSPRQEDTLALLDESIHMFAGWLVAQTSPSDSAVQKPKG
jgi:AcrR family transcriptional regulator